MKKYNQIQNRTYELLARGSAKDLQSLIVDIFLFVLILLNVTAVCLESVKFIRESYSTSFPYTVVQNVAGGRQQQGGPTGIGGQCKTVNGNSLE